MHLPVVGAVGAFAAGLLALALAAHNAVLALVAVISGYIRWNETAA